MCGPSSVASTPVITSMPRQEQKSLMRLPGVAIGLSLRTPPDEGRGSSKKVPPSHSMLRSVTISRTSLSPGASKQGSFLATW